MVEEESDLAKFYIIGGILAAGLAGLIVWLIGVLI